LRVVDSADTTAARVSRIIDVNRIGATSADASSPNASAPHTEIVVTADPARFQASAARLFTDPLPAPVLLQPAAWTIRVLAGS
jgi:hypothetical protein